MPQCNKCPSQLLHNLFFIFLLFSNVAISVERACEHWTHSPLNFIVLLILSGEWKKEKEKKEEKVLAIWCRCNNCKFVYHMLNVHDKRFALITRIMLMIKSTAAVAMNESLLDKCWRRVRMSQHESFERNVHDYKLMCALISSSFGIGGKWFCPLFPSLTLPLLLMLPARSFHISERSTFSFSAEFSL